MGGAEIYWTGDFTGAGNPSYSKKLTDARTFETAREGYEVGGSPEVDLKYWKVGKRLIQYNQSLN
jgi:hypothetical protein